MNILIVSASAYEINPLLKLHTIGDHVECLITGLGMVNTVFEMMTLLERKKFDLVINAGICGAYSKQTNLGEVLNVTSDRFADIALDHNGVFFPIDKALSTTVNQIIENNSVVINPLLSSIEEATSITLNTITGSNERKEQILQWYAPDIETMEGAAVAFVCQQKRINYVQLRGVSNYVEPRNTNNWNMPLAIKNLNQYILEFLKFV